MRLGLHRCFSDTWMGLSHLSYAFLYASLPLISSLKLLIFLVYFHILLSPDLPLFIWLLQGPASQAGRRMCDIRVFGISANTVRTVGFPLLQSTVAKFGKTLISNRGGSTSSLPAMDPPGLF